MIPYFILLVLSFIIGLPSSPWFITIGYDREIFRYGGSLVAHGFLIYRDFFEIKPPLIFLTAGLGDLFGPWGFWAIECLFIAAAATAVYHYSQIEKFKFIVPILFILLMGSYPLNGDGGLLSRMFSSCLLFIAYFGILGSFSMTYVGALAGGIFLFQENEVLPILGVTALTLWRTPDKARVRELAPFVCGGLLIIFPVYLWLMITGAIRDYADVFIFMFTYVKSSLSLVERTSGFFSRLTEIKLLIPLIALVIVLAGVTYRPYSERSKKIATILWIALPLQIMSICLSGRFYGHYFLGLVPLICIGALLVLEQKKIELKAIIIPLFFIPILSESYSKPFLESFARWKQSSFSLPLYLTYNEEFNDLLEPLRGQSGKFLAFRNVGRLHLHSYFEIAAPTKWVVTHFWDHFPTFDDIKKTRFNELLESLNVAQTEIVLDHSSMNPLPGDLQDMWLRHRSAHYQFLRNASYGGELYRRIKVQ